jgi:hypothetical protein
MELSRPGILLITKLEPVGKPFNTFVGLIIALALSLGPTSLLTIYNMKQNYHRKGTWHIYILIQPILYQMRAEI